MPVYPLTMPFDEFSDFIWELSHNVKRNTSPISRQEQVTLFSGGSFSFTFSLPAMRKVKANAWKAFLAQLKSGYGTFYGYDPDNRTPQGVISGTPLIKGAAQTGTVLETDGHGVSVSGILLPGDYIQINSGLAAEIKMVTEQVDSDALGNATINFEPALRTPPADNDVFVYNNPVGAFRLVAGPSRAAVNNVGIYEMSFAAVEAF